MNDRTGVTQLGRWVLAAIVVLTGCGGETGIPTESGPPSLGKAGGGPTVTAADPAYGKQGETNKNVSILGTGFQPGDQASWQRNGAADPKIQVLSTQYVTSTQLIATINIASDAELALYDVAVAGLGRKGGIGTEMFEVTTATVLVEVTGTGNTSVAVGISDAGLMVGRSKTQAAVWSGAGVESLGPGRALDIDAAGTTIVGSTSLTTDGNAMKWTGAPGGWVAVPLSTGCAGATVQGSTARAVSADGLVAGGHILVSAGHNKTKATPVLWDLTTTQCQLLAFPSGYPNYARVNDVNGVGRAVGMAIGTTNGAVVWTGGVPVVLAPLPGASDGDAEGISRDGSVVVGMSGGRPAYWLWNGTGWSAPVELLTGPCRSANDGWANDVSDEGVIVGKGCDGGAWTWVLTAGVVSSSLRLRGLGSPNGAAAEAVRNGLTSGPWVVGSASDRAVYWNQP